MAEIKVNFTVNGVLRTIETEPSRTLLAVLREDLKLTSVKEGCGQGDCGACVVLADGLAINSCLVLVGQVQGKNLLTLEGLEQNGKLHPIQQHFMEKWAFQCGYCTPGMIMSCYALLLRNPSPSETEIREAISGNLCRCTNYSHIIEAVTAAACDMNKITSLEGDERG